MTLLILMTCTLLAYFFVVGMCLGIFALLQIGREEWHGLEQPPFPCAPRANARAGATSCTEESHNKKERDSNV